MCFITGGTFQSVWSTPVTVFAEPYPSCWHIHTNDFKSRMEHLCAVVGFHGNTLLTRRSRLQGRLLKLSVSTVCSLQHPHTPHSLTSSKAGEVTLHSPLPPQTPGNSQVISGVPPLHSARGTFRFSPPQVAAVTTSQVPIPSPHRPLTQFSHIQKGTHPEMTPPPGASGETVFVQGPPPNLIPACSSRLLPPLIVPPLPAPQPDATSLSQPSTQNQRH